MRYLILGGCGYCGSTLIPAILQQSVANEVTCIDNLRYQNASALAGFLGDRRVMFVKGDIRDKVLMQRVLRTADVVVNLAALVGMPVCDKHPLEAVAVNQDAVREFVPLLSPNQTLVQLTSNSGYGATDGQSEVDEDSPLNPVSLYGRTKVEAEKACLDHPRSISLRLATVFGVSPRMRFDLMVNDWTYQLTKKKEIVEGWKEIYPMPFSIFEPHFSRNYVHVRDVCSAILHVVGHPPYDKGRPGVYNVGNPDANCTKWELAQRICKTIGLDEKFLEVDHASRDEDGRNYRVSNAKILATGFRFRASLEDGIREVSQYARIAPEDAYKTWRNV